MFRWIGTLSRVFSRHSKAAANIENDDTILNQKTTTKKKVE
jgi:hypothetical protein